MLRPTAWSWLTVCAAAAVAIPAHSDRPIPPPIGEPACRTTPQDRDPDAATTCGLCHKAIYDEWNGRAHSRAWTDPLYQAALKKRRRPELCHACHIPEPVHKRLGRRPKTRDRHRDEGVTCVTCHRSGDAIAGPFGANTDAHATVKHPAYTERGSVSLCASCHDTEIGPVLPVARDFLESGLAEKGKSCIGCHMPEVERHVARSFVTGQPVGARRAGRRHNVLGPGDPEFCAKAFAIEVGSEDGDLVVMVSNEAGHRVPGLKLREFAFTVDQRGSDGRSQRRDGFVISHENPILLGETREFRFDRAATARTAQVTVVHRFQESETELIRSDHSL